MYVCVDMHVHVHDDATTCQDEEPDAADMLWLNDSQEELYVTVFCTLHRTSVCALRKARGNVGAKMELGLLVNAHRARARA